MRIVILSSASTWAGAEVHAAGLAGHLTERGHATAIGCLTPETLAVYEPFVTAGVSLLPVWNCRPAGENRYRDWRRLFQQVDAKACIFEKPTLNVGTLGLDAAARRVFDSYVTIEQFEPPVIVRSSRRRLGGLAPGLGLWWRRLVLKGHARSWFPHRVIANSHHTRQRLVDEFHFRSAKTLTVQNGVSTAAFAFDPEMRAKQRRDWGFGDDVFVFGSVRRLEAEKGLDFAIRALGMLAKEQPSAKTALVLVGEGSARRTLEAVTKECGVADRVRFTGFMANPRTAYCAFDGCVVPSLIEPLGIALLEAMACERPCIASAVGGMREIIRDPAVGWLVVPGDAEALLAAMKELWALPDSERAALGRRGRYHVQEHFEAAQQFGKIAEIVESLSV